MLSFLLDILLIVMIFLVVFMFIFNIYLPEIKSKTLTHEGNTTEKLLDVEVSNYPSKTIYSDPSNIEEILIEFDMAIKTGNAPSPALCSSICKILQTKKRSTIQFESEKKGSEEQVNKQSNVKNVGTLVKSLNPVKSKRFVTHEELDQLSKLMPYHHDEQSIHQFTYLIAQTEVKKRNVEFKNPIFEYEPFKPVHYADIHAPPDELCGNITESQTMHNSCKVVGGLLRNDCNIKNKQSLPNELSEEYPEISCKWQDNYLII